MNNELPLKHHIQETTMEKLKPYHKPNTFIEYCKACRYYNKIWTCPPYETNIVKQLEGFQYAYIIGSRLRFKDMQETNTMTHEANHEDVINSTYKAARQILDDMLMKIEADNDGLYVLLAGRCILCSSCSREKQLPCLYPGRARFSLESLGYDVSSISKDILGMEIQWAKDGLPEYLTLVSAVLSREKFIRGIFL
jgi:predicted metal-binding protein